jgi:hypothetical protein
MGRGIFDNLLKILESKGESLLDKRAAGRNFRYTLTNALKCAFSVFFFQYPSLLHFQHKMQEKRRRNNMETIFKVGEIPSDPQIRTLMDGIEPIQFGDIFNESLQAAERCGVLASYRVLDGGVLIALDGVWYHSSEKIHCKHCLYKTSYDKKREETVTTYYHTILAGTIVKPGDTTVLPVMGEPIRNDDGQKKQDSELKAAKRWLDNYADEYKWLKPTLLGDDLFSNYPMCKAILDKGLSFIFTCKPQSHPWLSETVENSYLEEKTRREWNGRHHLVYRYRWLNGVEIRDSRETLKVNYMYLEIENEQKGKITYRNSWVTDKPINEDNAVLIASCGRARWKIENEHNNILKNHGYNLEHNFGHGEEYASEMFCLLNLLAFLWHGILWLADEVYHQARINAGRRDEFFNELRGSMRYVLHENWQTFMIFARDGPGE